MLLWLWCTLAATALITPLAWERPICRSCGPKKEKEKKKKKKKGGGSLEVLELISPSSQGTQLSPNPIKKAFFGFSGHAHKKGLPCPAVVVSFVKDGAVRVVSIKSGESGPSTVPGRE